MTIFRECTQITLVARTSTDKLDGECTPTAKLICSKESYHSFANVESEGWICHNKVGLLGPLKPQSTGLTGLSSPK